MFNINSLRPVKYGKFELRVGDNQFEDAKAIPADLRGKLLHFAEVPPFQERGILVFDPSNPWPELAPKAAPVEDIEDDEEKQTDDDAPPASRA